MVIVELKIDRCSFQLDFQATSDQGAIDTYVPNGEWHLIGRFEDRLKERIFLQHFDLNLQF